MKRRKALPRSILVAAGLVVLLVVAVGAIWTTGGFGTDAKPFLGTRVEPGEMVETRFWDVAAHSAEVDEASGTILLKITVVNKQRRSSSSLTHGMVVIRLPDGTPMLLGSCFSDRGGYFAPFIPADGSCTFSYASEELPAEVIPGPGPFDVEVVVRDQVISDNLLTIPELAPGEPAGWLPLTVQAVLKEES